MSIFHLTQISRSDHKYDFFNLNIDGPKKASSNPFKTDTCIKSYVVETSLIQYSFLLHYIFLGVWSVC